MNGMVTIKIKRLDRAYAAVLSPFSAKDDVKALPSARWDKTIRAWVILSLNVEGAARDLRRLGYAVELEGFRTVDTPRVNEPWEAMFSAVPVALRAKTYRALVKVLHPDAGGDLAAMQALTVAFEKVGA